MGIDYVMMGDIHKFSRYKEGRLVLIYASSMNTLSFNEYTRYNGMIQWDINNNKQYYIRIKNERQHKRYIIFKDNEEIKVINEEVFENRLY